MESAVPSVRRRSLNGQPFRADGEFVVYWMVAAQRTSWNFGLERAVELAVRFSRPLVILEILRCDYRWASDRLHAFALAGMAENARRLTGRPVLHWPFVERVPGESRGLIEALAARACAVVLDEFPSYFLPRIAGVAAVRSPVGFEVVDGNGLLPLHATSVVFETAHAFRRFVQRSLRAFLDHLPTPDPTASAELPPRAELPAEISQRWPAAPPELLEGERSLLSELPIDHSVPPAPARGGTAEAERALTEFLTRRLQRYADERSLPEHEVGSGLSPYLHFGQISIHEVFARLMEHVGWSPDQLSRAATGNREGFWNVERNAEALLDELVVWRELGYNFCCHREDYDQYDSLPEWAKETLGRHAADPRPHLYTLAQLEAAETHDPLWNATQRQLLREGRIHSYLRMLWGKKILEWSPSPRAALDALIRLNNRHALDGRNPNSYTGIFWCLGRYDRPWAPLRPIFGTVRYMSSTNTARKFSVRHYLERFGPEGELFD